MQIDPLTRQMHPDMVTGLEQINAETPRGKVLVVSAMIESKLRECFQALLMDDPKVQKHYQRAGTFESVIFLAFALGLISAEEHKQLLLVKEVRNKFG